VGAIIKKEYALLPPTVGYLRMYSHLKTKYARLPRKAVQDFLRRLYRQITRQARPKFVTGAGKVWTADIKVLPKTHFKARSCTGIFVIVENTSKYVCAYPIESESQPLPDSLLKKLWLKRLFSPR
jgi:hypothetical protein